MSNNLKKHTLNLREGDFDEIADRFENVGASLVIRRIVSNFVDNLRSGDKQAAFNISEEEEA